ncbi:hypothetical protein E2562_027344 [Oryza meyeriana var. granulata]|uniref:DUF834 domain-containing protein n=1 Tax=Oryza meyeriana var. granulata TaxID=110450 RepID=A0A6G1E1A0_9ORYZ|nr:hypothetical protein E2562_027344 [Oryza meyeriana var. granulata]
MAGPSAVGHDNRGRWWLKGRLLSGKEGDGGGGEEAGAKQHSAHESGDSAVVEGAPVGEGNGWMDRWAGQPPTKAEAMHAMERGGAEGRWRRGGGRGGRGKAGRREY